MAITSDILENLITTQDYLELKFKKTLMVSTIQNDRFSVVSKEATPVEVPLEEIVIAEHYNSISRTLVLIFKTLPTYVGQYDLTISGLKDASGATLPTETIVFDYDWDNEPDGDSPLAEDDVLVPIEDHSIQKRAFLASETIRSANPDFYIVGTDPQNNDIFVENDYNNGRITVTFSTRPQLSYLNSSYIKVQRKLMSAFDAATPISRWETLTAQYALDAAYPKLYIYIPSIDATPVYDTVGHIYFESGYKYRVRFSGDIEAQ